MTRARSDVPPTTLSVDLAPEGVGITYLDGREVFYHGVPEAVAGPVRTHPKTAVHVLVTDEDGHEGVLTYVNDRTTHDDVLESTGVGRVFVDPGDREELFPGVTVEMDGYAAVVDADPAVVGGRVFVFEENELGQRSFEVVGAEAADADGGDSGGDPDDAGTVGPETGDPGTEDGRDDPTAGSGDGDSEAGDRGEGGS